MQSRSGMSLTEVLIAGAILAILAPLAIQTYTSAVQTQTRRAVQEEAVIFASDYLEHTKLQVLNKKYGESFDTVRVFRNKTLILQRNILSDSADSDFQTERFSISSDSSVILTMQQKVPKVRGFL